MQHEVLVRRRVDVLEQRGQVVLQVARRDVAEREGGRRLDLVGVGARVRARARARARVRVWV